MTLSNTSISLDAEVKVKEQAMPDGDRIHSKILRGYAGPYRLLCEGKNLDGCLEAFQKQILKDVCSSGNGVLYVIDELSKEMSKQEKISSFYSVSERVEFRKAVPNLLAREFVDRVVHKNLSILQGYTVPLEETKQKLIVGYVQEYFDFHLKGKIQYLHSHHNGLSLSDVMQKTKFIDDKLQDFYKDVAKKAVKSGRFPSRIPKKKREINLDHNLLSLAAF